MMVILHYAAYFFSVFLTLVRESKPFNRVDIAVTCFETLLTGMLDLVMVE